MAWVYLLLAGAAEIAWMIGLKYSDGFARFWPSLVTIAAMGISLLFLSLALRSIPMGTAYAIWTGIGAAGIAALGMLFFHEPATVVRVACIGLIVIGIAGLKVSSSA